MRGHIAALACVLLLFTLTAFFSCNAVQVEPKIRVERLNNKIALECVGKDFSIFRGGENSSNPLTLPYSDDKSGEYTCKDNSGDENKDSTSIFVKFRTCDNCIQLNLASMIGMVVGNVIATSVIGVGVYLLASQSRTTASSSYKKSSDRAHLLPTDSSSRAPNDHYQPLRHKGDKQTYDVLSNVR